MNIYTKFRKLINYIRSDCNLQAYFYHISELDSNTIHCHLVPYDFGIEKIPLFKKYCKKAGFTCTNVYISDNERHFGYQDYHDCIITYEDLIEKIKGDNYEEN